MNRTPCHVGDRPPRRGIVLLLVLFAIVLAGVGLTMIARASVRQAIAARDARDRLQTKWGERTAGRLMLDAAPAFFQQQDALRRAQPSLPRGPARTQFVLGGQTFDIVIADEDAKANLNTIYHTGGAADVQRAVRQLVGPTVQPLLAISPQVASQADRRRQSAASTISPGDEDASNDGYDEPDDLIEPPAAFATWADLVDVARLRRDAGDARVLAQLSADLSLRGSGRLNARRARPEAIVAVAQTVVTEGLARRIVDRIESQPTAEIRLVLRTLVKNDRDRRRLERLLGQQSNSFSVWIETSTLRSRSQRYAVRRRTPDGEMRTYGLSL